MLITAVANPNERFNVITNRSVKDMKLKKGDRVFVMIKATEASIQKVREAKMVDGS